MAKKAIRKYRNGTHGASYPKHRKYLLIFNKCSTCSYQFKDYLSDRDREYVHELVHK